MGLREWLVPQDEKFFDSMDAIAGNVLKGAKALETMVGDWKDPKVGRDRVKAIEHAGDMLVHNVFQDLNKTFITPIDQEDIGSLVSRYDDILDYVYASANRMYLYKVEKATPPMVKLAATIVQAVEALNVGLTALRDPRRGDEAGKACIEVNRLENVADDLLNTAVAGLFNDGHDAVYIIKHKEIYEFLENATDKCEDASDIIRGILVKRG